MINLKIDLCTILRKVEYNHFKTLTLRNQVRFLEPVMMKILANSRNANPCNTDKGLNLLIKNLKGF